jgi:hypothetical protein
MRELEVVLEEIRAGKKSFQPATRADQDMRDFQPIAKMLVYAHREQLLESCVPHKESETGHDYYDLVVVPGGLSYKGELYLAETPPKSVESAGTDAPEIFAIRPTFWGISIDLKALWRRRRR